MRKGSVLIASLILAACAGPPPLPEDVEISTMRPRNVLPKSSPDQLLAAFQRYCMAKTATDARQALREDDYVRARSNRPRIETYLVDTNDPAVSIAPNASDFDCVLGARARTGQTNGIKNFVSKTFPAARKAEPSRLGSNVEAAWLAPGNRGGIVYLQRSGVPGPPEFIRFGVLRPERS